MAYRRSIILINPKFQIKMSLLICLILLIATSIYPFVIYDNFEQFIIFTKKFSPKYYSQLVKNQKELISILLIWQAGFFLLTFGIMIFFTHKIAGPIFKLKQYLIALRSEKYYKKLFFRKGDHFCEIADEFNITLGQIHENTIRDSVYIDEVHAYIKKLEVDLSEDKKEICNKIAENLKKISSNYHL